MTTPWEEGGWTSGSLGAVAEAERETIPRVRSHRRIAVALGRGSVVCALVRVLGVWLSRRRQLHLCSSLYFSIRNHRT